VLKIEAVATVQTSVRSAQTQHSLDNDGGVGDCHSLDQQEDIRVNLADHAKNATYPLLADFAKTLGALS